MKLNIQRLALLLVVAGSVSAFAAYQERKGTPARVVRSCSGTPALIKVSSSGDTVPWVSSDQFGVLVRQYSTIPVTTGGTACGTLQSGSGADTDFPTSGTYNAVSGIFMDANNNNSSIVPMSAYTLNTIPNQGDEWTSVTTTDGGDHCNLTDDYGNTVWFYKACLTGLTRND